MKHIISIDCTDKELEEYAHKFRDMEDDSILFINHEMNVFSVKNPEEAAFERLTEITRTKNTITSSHTLL